MTSNELDCGTDEWNAGNGMRKCCCGLYQNKAGYEMHLRRDADGNCEHELRMMRGRV